MACPVCGSISFHVKSNPEDQFDVSVFELRQGTLRPVDPDDDCPVDESTELYCQRCAWHGKLGEL